MENIPNIPRLLRESLESNRLVLFVGSGVSRTAKAPTWKQLVEGLVERFREECVDVQYETQLRRLLNGTADDLIWAVEYLKSIRRDIVDDQVRKICKNLTPHTIHDIIVKVPCAGIITTNFDNLIERAYIAERGNVDVVLPNNVDGLARLEDRSPWILKLHGSFENAESTVLSLTEYESLMNKPSIASTVSRLFQRYTILFIGFGLRDPDTIQQISQLRMLFEGYQRRHYALFEKDAIDEVHAKVFSDVYGIQILYYTKSSDSHPEVGVFLNSLSKHCSSGPVKPISKLFFIVKSLADDKAKTPLLMVQAPDSGDLANQIYWFPSLTDNPNYNTETLRKDIIEHCTEHWRNFDPLSFSVKLDEQVFRTKKVSVTHGEEREYKIRFVTVSTKINLLNLLGSQIRYKGHLFEWQPLSVLKKHVPTANSNSDVLNELTERYGNMLEGIP